MGENESEALAVFLSPVSVDRPDYVSARSLARNCLRSADSLNGVRVFVYTDPRHEDWVRELVSEDAAVEVRTRGPHGRDRLREKVENWNSSPRRGTSVSASWGTCRFDGTSTTATSNAPTDRLPST